jgi:phospholipid-transporting ATPase
MILINSKIPKGICYVETKNLDGETNLKHKQARAECISRAQTEEEVSQNFKGVRISCEQPNNAIYKFEGNMHFPDGTVVPLGVDNMLLRGSSLRNTEWVFGIAVFTGMESKVM